MCRGQRNLKKKKKKKDPPTHQIRSKSDVILKREKKKNQTTEMFLGERKERPTWPWSVSGVKDGIIETQKRVCLKKKREGVIESTGIT